MSGEFAGGLTERVTIERRDSARDAIGGASGGWLAVGTLWAAVTPDGQGAQAVADALSAMPRWRIMLRAADARPGDRVLWGARTLLVLRRTDDPTRPDRVVLTAEEQR